MSNISELDRLAEELSRNSAALSLYREREGLPAKATDSISPATLIPEDAPQHIFAAKEAIREAALRISHLVLDPREFLNSFQVEVSSALKDPGKNR